MINGTQQVFMCLTSSAFCVLGNLCLPGGFFAVTFLTLGATYSLVLEAVGCSAASLPLPPHEDQTCLQMWLWNSPGGRIRIISWEARTNPKEATLSAFCYSCHLFKTLVFNCTAHCFSLCHQPLFFSCFTIFLLVFGFRKLSYDIAMDGFLVFTVWVHRASWIHGFPFYFFVFCFSSQQIWTSLATASSKIFSIPFCLLSPRTPIAHTVHGLVLLHRSLLFRPISSQPLWASF